MTTTVTNQMRTTPAVTAGAVSLATTLISLTMLAAPPTIDFTQVQSTYVYQGVESRDDLAAEIAKSRLVWSGPLTEATLFAGDGQSDEGYSLAVNFTVSSCDAGLWSFRLGPDFGRGGAIFVDGVRLADSTADLWWGFDWNETSQLLVVSDASLAAGSHQAEVFGFEDCCAGAMSLEYQVGDTGWQAVSLTNLTPPDQDQDGVADCDDACPQSDLSPTVVIGGCDSQVANALLASGCTIADEIAHCAATASNHGAFVSCVAHLTSALKAQGVITGAGKGAIQSCAAQSSAGK